MHTLCTRYEHIDLSTTLKLYFVHCEIFAFLHARAHACTHTRTHAHTHARAHTCTRARARTHTHRYIHTDIHTHMHTYTHTYIHAYIHTYIHTHDVQSYFRHLDSEGGFYYYRWGDAPIRLLGVRVFAGMGGCSVAIVGP